MASAPSLSLRTLPVLLAAHWHKRRDAPFHQHPLMWPLLWITILGAVCCALATMGLTHLVHGPVSGSQEAAALADALGIFWVGVCSALMAVLLMMAPDALAPNTPATGFGLGHLRLLWCLSAIAGIHHGTFLAALATTHDPVLSISYAGYALLWTSLAVFVLLVAAFVVLVLFVEMDKAIALRHAIPARRAHKAGAGTRFARMRTYQSAAFRRQALRALPIPLAGIVLYAASSWLPRPTADAALVTSGVLLLHATVALLLPRPRWLAARRALWAWAALLWIGACFLASYAASRDTATALHVASAWAIAAPIALLLAWAGQQARVVTRRARRRFVEDALDGMSAHQRLALYREQA